MQQLQVGHILCSMQANGSRNQPLQVGHSQLLHVFAVFTLFVETVSDVLTVLTCVPQRSEDFGDV